MRDDELILIESGKLRQYQPLILIWTPFRLTLTERAAFDDIVIPLEFQLYSLHPKVRAKSNYKGRGNVVKRGKEYYVLIGDYDEYEMDEKPTKESNDFYLGFVWGVHETLQSMRPSFSVQDKQYYESRVEKCPTSEAGRAGYKEGAKTAKKILKRVKR